MQRNKKTNRLKFGIVTLFARYANGLKSNVANGGYGFIPPLHGFSKDEKINGPEKSPQQCWPTPGIFSVHPLSIIGWLRT
jgi:hypothetical protein